MDSSKTKISLPSLIIGFVAVIIIAIYGIISINTGQEGDNPKETERRQGQSGVESEWEVRENEKGEKYCYHITSKDSSPEPETTKSGSESEELEPESATSELELSETEPKQESEKTEPANSAESTGDTGKDSEEQNEPNKDNAIQNQEQITEEQSADNQSIPEKKASENLAEDSTEEQWVVKVTDDGVFYCASPDDEPEQQEQQVTFSNSSITKTQGDGKFINSATTTGDGEITYSSNNTNVATVDQKTGEVTIKSAGITEISAIAAETTNYSSASATYILTVNKSQNTTAGWITKKDGNKTRYYFTDENGKNITGLFKTTLNGKVSYFYGIPDKGYIIKGGYYKPKEKDEFYEADSEGRIIRAYKWVIKNKQRYCYDLLTKKNKTGLFQARDYKGVLNWFYGLPNKEQEKQYVLRGTKDLGNGFVYIADNEGRLLDKTGTYGKNIDGNGFIVTDIIEKTKQRYNIDSKKHAAKSGFFKVGNNWYYGTSKGYIKHSSIVTLSSGKQFATDSNGKIEIGKSGWHYYDSNNLIKATDGPLGKGKKKPFYCKVSKKQITKNQKIEACWITLPQWVEDLQYVQTYPASQKEDAAKFGKEDSCGLIAITSAVQILRNDESLTPKSYTSLVINEYPDQEDKRAFNWGKLRQSPASIYENDLAVEVFSGNQNMVTDTETFKKFKNHLLQGHMIVANVMSKSEKPTFRLSNSGKTRNASGHTILFYKYENGKFWAKDSYQAEDKSIGYTREDLKKLFRTTTSNSIVAIWRK